MRQEELSPEEHPVPIHDWTRVDAGIFHAFHHDWITELARALNRGLLPADYYALPEQHAAGFGPDVLTFQEENSNGAVDQAFAETPATGGLTPMARRARELAGISVPLSVERFPSLWGQVITPAPLPIWPRQAMPGFIPVKRGRANAT